MRLPDYEIKGVVGEGGIGVVYRARHLVSNKPVALKVLHDHCGRHKDLVEKLFVEAKATSRIHHPNMTDVTDLGTTANGTVFVATDYLDGESLETRLRRVQRLPLFDAINIVKQVAHGLGAAHELGIVHGDLKPANIFLCSREGRRRIVRRSKETGMRFTVVPEKTFDLVKLLDFGASSFIDFAPSAQTPAELVCRTPSYLSPEQTQGRPTDPRCDIYALGAIFYQMVTGTVPVSGETVPAIIHALATASVIAPSRRTPEAGASLRIDSLILKCLHKNPSLRFASMADLCTALDDCPGDCAYLRDAQRLPGIQFSDIDLSQTSLEARHEAPPAQTPAAEPIAKVAKSAPQTMALGSLVHEARAIAARVRPVVQPAPRQTEAKGEPPQVDRQVEETAERPVQTQGVQKVIVVPGTPAQAAPPEAATPPLEATPALENHHRSAAPWLLAIGGVVLAGLAVAFWPQLNGESPTTQSRVAIPAPAPTPAVPERPAAIAPAPSPVAPAPGAPAAAPTPAAPVAAAPTPAAPAAAAPAPSAPAAAAPAPSAPAVPAAPAAAPAVAAEPSPAPAVPAAAPQTEEEPVRVAKAGSTGGHRGRHKKDRRAVIARASEEARAPTAEPAETAEVAAKPEAESEPAAEPFAASEPEAPEAEAGSSVSVEDRLLQAQRAARKGHPKSAIRKARAALKAEAKPDQVMQAYRIIATSSCALGKVAAAREAASHLDKPALTAVKAACKKDGVAIE